MNHMFDNGLREEYKEISDDDLTKRSNNCHTLAAVECNSLVLFHDSCLYGEMLIRRFDCICIYEG